ncbi:MAG TPA: cupredoxin family protein [Gammaproteobacteria bacterium]
MKMKLSISVQSGLLACALASGVQGGPAHERSTAQGDDMTGMHRDMGHAESGPAVGRPGDPAQVSRTVDIIMDDTMRFTPDEIDVKSGETVRFFVKNMGRQKHELVIGPMDELREHAEMMRRMPDMQHAEPNMIALAPDQRGGLVWQFDQAGTVDFACLVPGHLEAGMVGKVNVE